MFKEKIDRLRHDMLKHNVCGAVLSNIDSVYYLTGYQSVMDGWHLPEPLSAVYVPANQDLPITLLIPEANIIAVVVSERHDQPIYFDRLRTFELLNFCRTARAEDAYLDLPTGLLDKLNDLNNFVDGHCQVDILTATTAMLKECHSSSETIMFDDMRLALRVNQANKQSYTDAYDSLFRVRSIKTPAEINLFLESGHKADKIMAHAVSQLGVGKKWSDVEKSVSKFMVDNDVAPLATSPMLFGGTYDLVFRPDLFRTVYDTPFKKGEIIILETQGKYKNIWLDINRTAFVGKASKEYRAQHKLVTECFKQSLANLDRAIIQSKSANKSGPR